MVERAAAAAGLELKTHPHMLRHACGYALANKGHDTRAIQGWLGHRSITSTCSNWIAGAINPAWVNGATLVPIPPSKARSDPEFDDRMTQICHSIPVQFPLDVRELITQRESTQAAHEGDDRPTVEGLLHIYEINEAACAPTPQRIAIVDDVLTVGVHYRAMHIRLSQRFPGVPIVGMFIARRVFPNDVTADQLTLL